MTKNGNIYPYVCVYDGKLGQHPGSNTYTHIHIPWNIDNNEMEKGKEATGGRCLLYMTAR